MTAIFSEKHILQKMHLKYQFIGETWQIVVFKAAFLNLMDIKTKRKQKEILSNKILGQILDTVYLKFNILPIFLFINDVNIQEKRLWKHNTLTFSVHCTYAFYTIHMRYIQNIITKVFGIYYRSFHNFTA